MHRIATLILVSFLAAPNALAQTTRYVATTGEDVADCTNEASPCATVTYAINQATDGNTIEIADGEYTESFEINKSLSLHGESEAGTIIQAAESPGEADSRVITIDGDFEVEIVDMTIRHGVATGSPLEAAGGGLFNDGATLVLANITFSGNEAGYAGGGMFNRASSPVLTNVAFNENAAGDGSGNGSGGGMYNLNSSPTLIDASFSGNVAEIQGGGLYTAGGSPTLTNATFSNNTAGASGGGMYNGQNNSVDLTNVAFSGNDGGLSGGGLTMSSNNAPLTLTNVTVSGNTATEIGGGIFVISDSSAVLTNTILWGNTAGENGNEISAIGDGSVVLHYSLYSNEPGDIEGDFEAENSLTEDPLFVDPESGDLHLEDMSPAINAGDPATPDSIFATNDDGEPVDLDGNLRFFGDAIDIGAYESQFISGGGTRYVNGTTGSDTGNCTDEASPCATISYAIGQATSLGDTINVIDGEYTESLNIQKPLTLQGESETGTIIQAHESPGEANSRVITIDTTGVGQLDVTISDVTIRYGNATGSSEANRGGGISNNGAALTVTNVSLNENHAAGGIRGGGGLYNASTEPLVLTNVTFHRNTGGSGGGLFHGGPGTNSGPALLTNVTFNENEAESNGGGMVNRYSSATLKNVTFYANMASYGGGYLDGNSESSLTNVAFIANTVTGFGGGIRTHNSDSLLLSNTTFSGNEADSGGAIHNFGSSITLNNSILWGNLAPVGSELTNDGSSIAELHYSLYNDSSGSIEGGGVFFFNSLTDDPLFVDPENGDLRLEDTSPAIDVGDPATPDSIFATNDEGEPIDLDGNPRVFGDGVDIGAYENQGTVADEASPGEIAEGLTLPAPNPVRGVATLTVAAEVSQDVTVEVFDALGRRVQTLYNADLAAGTSETLTVDASVFPAGLYIIRATGETFAETRRITVIR